MILALVSKLSGKNGEVMRKTSANIKEAFFKGIKKSCGNTRTDGKSVFLFDSEIIRKEGEGFIFCLHGYDTNIAIEIINSILGTNLYKQHDVVKMGNNEEVDLFEKYHLNKGV